MYVFQFMDATWRIARVTNSKIAFETILKNKPALALFDGVYETAAAARQAERQIRQMIGVEENFLQIGAKYQGIANLR